MGHIHEKGQIHFNATFIQQNKKKFKGKCGPFKVKIDLTFTRDTFYAFVVVKDAINFFSQLLHGRDSCPVGEWAMLHILFCAYEVGPYESILYTTHLGDHII